MTTPVEFRRIERLFHELDGLDATAREERLRRADTEDPHVAAEVRRLLDHRTGDTAAVVAEPSDANARIGEQVGPYLIESVLGEGGMGVVYAAVQHEPVRRRVALKLVRSGVDRREVVARFEAERQTLAIMSHPNIAKVFDAGSAADGRPYFVMELVHGRPITHFCDEQRLDTRARLELFAEVCDAVEHAHRRGVIHRDLKPSNVIVSAESGAPEPKVIDFGVAKATSMEWTPETAFTRAGQLVGTPEYMSPEQADLDQRDVDTRSDVYALGVLLYELLSGQLPQEPAALRDVGLGEILRRIREVEPPKPSKRLRALAEGSSEAAARSRRIEPRSLARMLDGDLDWIVMQAIEKDRDRRYGSVAQLAADVRNYLANRPVLAGPPNITYRIRKFARRHRALVAGGVLALVTLAVGVTATSLALVRAVRAERTAAQERDNAQLRLGVAESVSAFLVRLFESSDPLNAAPGELTVERLLERGVERVDEDLRDQPSVRADVLRTLGRVYGGMGHYRKAQALLEQAVELRRDLPAGQIEDASRDLNELAIVYRRLGELDLAAEMHGRALELLEAGSLGGGLSFATHLHGLAVIHMQRREFDAAKPALERALEIFRREGSASEVPALTNLAVVVGGMGDHEGAADYLRESLALRTERDGPEHVHVANVLNSLANELVNLGRYDEADPLYARALAIWTNSLGEQHLNVARVHNNLGYMYHRQGRWNEAVESFGHALEIKAAIYGADHAQLVQPLTNLAESSRQAGDLAAADRHLERGRRIGERDSRVTPRSRFDNLTARASLRLTQRRFEEAVRLYEHALAQTEMLSEQREASLRENLDAARRGGVPIES